jgi:hypothetical protein
MLPKPKPNRITPISPSAQPSRHKPDRQLTLTPGQGDSDGWESQGNRPHSINSSLEFQPDGNAHCYRWVISLNRQVFASCPASLAGQLGGLCPPLPAIAVFCQGRVLWKPFYHQLMAV